MESVDTVVYVDKQRMLRSDCTDGHMSTSRECSDQTATLSANCIGAFFCALHIICFYGELEKIISEL